MKKYYRIDDVIEVIEWAGELNISDAPAWFHRKIEDGSARFEGERFVITSGAAQYEVDGGDLICCHPATNRVWVCPPDLFDLAHAPVESHARTDSDLNRADVLCEMNCGLFSLDGGPLVAAVQHVPAAGMTPGYLQRFYNTMLLFGFDRDAISLSLSLREGAVVFNLNEYHNVLLAEGEWILRSDVGELLYLDAEEFERRTKRLPQAERPVGTLGRLHVTEGAPA